MILNKSYAYNNDMTTEMKVHVVTLQVYMFQTMFSSMFSSMFTRDRGFIFILTNIFEILKIYLGNFLETYL